MYRLFLLSALLSTTLAFSGFNAKFRSNVALNAVPDSEDQKVFYALGLNVARQVGGEMKGLLSPEEIKSMVAGFSDSMTNELADDMAILQVIYEIAFSYEDYLPLSCI